MKDHLVRATAEGVRVFAAITSQLVGDAARRHDCYPTATAALGRTLTGALLFAADLKNEEAVTIKIQGDGPLGRIVADAVPEGYARGFVDNPHVDIPPTVEGKIDVGGGVGRNGLVTVTRFTGLERDVSGSCELVSGEIAEDLTNYLFVSEQTPSSVGLGVLVDTDLSVRAAGGFLVQPLPDASDAVLDRLEKNLRSMRTVTELIDGGLDARGLISTIFDGFDVKFLSEIELQFRCHCSRERVASTLSSLNAKDRAALLEDGHAEVVCQFCGEKYLFGGEELRALFE